jgi:hypothetical protein
MVEKEILILYKNKETTPNRIGVVSLFIHKKHISRLIIIAV